MKRIWWALAALPILAVVAAVVYEVFSVRGATMLCEDTIKHARHYAVALEDIADIDEIDSDIPPLTEYEEIDGIKIPQLYSKQGRHHIGIFASALDKFDFRKAKLLRLMLDPKLTKWDLYVRALKRGSDVAAVDCSNATYDQLIDVLAYRLYGYNFFSEGETILKLEIDSDQKVILLVLEHEEDMDPYTEHSTIYIQEKDNQLYYVGLFGGGEERIITATKQLSGLNRP